MEIYNGNYTHWNVKSGSQSTLLYIHIYILTYLCIYIYLVLFWEHRKENFECIYISKLGWSSLLFSYEYTAEHFNVICFQIRFWENEQ